MTTRRGDEAARRRGNAATEQRGNASTDWRGDAATEQRGNGLTRRRGNGATRQRTDVATWLTKRYNNTIQQRDWRGNPTTRFKWRDLATRLTQNVQVQVTEKKSAWTDLDRVSFKKFVKESNVEIEKSAWTGLDKTKRACSAASVFKKFLHDWLQKYALDKRCSRCYTLRGCVLSDVHLVKN
jgi:hypothetical protein